MPPYKIARCYGLEEVEEFISKANRLNYEIITMAPHMSAMGGVYIIIYRERGND